MSKELETVAREWWDKYAEDADTHNTHPAEHCAAFAAHVLSQQTPAGQVTYTISEEMRDFLLGLAPLDGVWFGQKKSLSTGIYWWRNMLRLSAPRTNEDAGGWVSVERQRPTIGQRYLVTDDEYTIVRALYWSRTHSRKLIWSERPNAGEWFTAEIMTRYTHLPSPPTK